MSVNLSWCSNLNRWDFFLKNALYVAWHMKKLWAFSNLVAAISTSLHETFVRSKYVNSVSQFLLYWMQIICCIYKDFVWQLKAFLPSFCHLCACEMSPGWGHLIIWMDPSVGHLNGILARVGGNLNNNFQKSQMPEGLPGGGGHVEASIWPIHNRAVAHDARSQRVIWCYWTSMSACFFGNNRSLRSRVRTRLITKCVYYEWVSDSYLSPCNNLWYARAYPRVKNSPLRGHEVTGSE